MVRGQRRFSFVFFGALELFFYLILFFLPYFSFLAYSIALRIPPARSCGEAVSIALCVGGAGGGGHQETKRQRDERLGKG